MYNLFGDLVKLQKALRKSEFIMLGITSSCVLFAALPAATSPRVVDFRSALSIADSANPEIRNGMSRIREQQQRKKQVASNLLPQVSASASYAHLGEVPAGKKYLLGNSNDDFYTDVTVKQLLYAGGKYKYQVSVSDTLTKVEEQKLLQIRRNTRLSVARAYFEAVKAKFAVDVQRDLIKRMQTQLGIAELLFDGGKISSLDVIRLRTQMLSAQSQLSTFESSVKTKQYMLAQAIGIIDTCAVVDSILPEDIDSLLINQTDLEKELGQSPEMQSALASYQKSLLDQKVAKADYFPTVSVNAGYNFEGGALIADQPTGGITNNPNWIIGASVTVPIYRGGSIRAQVAQAHERTLQSKIILDQITVNLTARLRSSIESVNDKKEKIVLAKQTLQSADETVRTAELRYSTGKLSAFELIDAQSMFARAQQDYFNARVDYRIAFEELAAICPSILKSEETLQ